MVDEIERIKRSEMNPKLIALVPARRGSVRIPNKNFRPFCGLPLILMTLFHAQQSGIFSKIGITTDAVDELQNILKNVNHDELKKNIIIRERPEKLSHGNMSEAHWIFDFFEHTSWDMCSHYMILRPTNPFRSYGTIQRAWYYYLTKLNGKVSLKSISPVSEHPFKMWTLPCDKHYMESLSGKFKNDDPVTIPGGNDKTFFELPTQLFPQYYVQNGCIDICVTDIIKNNKNRYHGEKIYPYILLNEEAYDINTIFDWDMAEAYYHKFVFQRRSFNVLTLELQFLYPGCPDGGKLN